MKIDKFKKFSPFQDLDKLPHISQDIVDEYVVTSSGQDCFQRASLYSKLFPNYRLQAGNVRSLMVDNQPGIKVPNSLFWNELWRVHLWLIDEEGNVFDPSIQNIEIYSKDPSNMVDLHLPPSDLQAISFDENIQKQQYMIGLIDKASFKFNVKDEGVHIIYFPGITGQHLGGRVDTRHPKTIEMENRFVNLTRSQGSMSFEDYRAINSELEDAFGLSSFSEDLLNIQKMFPGIEVISI